MTDRGFVYYPEAHTLHGWTRRTLTAMLNGEIGPDTAGDNVQRGMRERWRLPPDWKYVSPPIGSVTIPDSQCIDPGGITEFEIVLLGDSAVGMLAGDLVMDQLRNRLEDALGAVISTEHERVFAHLISPHPRFLYRNDVQPAGPPGCWPGCNLFTSRIENNDLTIEEWAGGMAGTLLYLNSRVIEAVDSVIARHSDAVIAIFSDHGGRYSYSDPGEVASIISRSTGSVSLIAPTRCHVPHCHGHLVP